MSNDVAWTSGTSWILTVASLQRLKMETYSRTRRLWSAMTKFLNAQSIALIEIHRQLCQVYGHMVIISCRIWAGRCFSIIHPIAWSSRSVMSIFTYSSASAFSDWQMWKWASQWLQFHAADFYDTEYKTWSHRMTNISIPEMKILKNSSIFAVCVSTNLSIKLGFVSVNVTRETFFMDALRIYSSTIVYFYC